MKMKSLKMMLAAVIAAAMCAAMTGCGESAESGNAAKSDSKTASGSAVEDSSADSTAAEEESESEETSVDEQIEIQTELTNQGLFDYEILVNGSVLKLPITAKEITQLGYTLEQGVSGLEPGEHISGINQFKHSESGVKVNFDYVLNTGDEYQSVKKNPDSEALVFKSISFMDGDNEDVSYSVSLAGGIEIGVSTIDDLVAAYGEPDKIDSSRDLYIYYENPNGTGKDRNNVTFKFHEDTGIVHMVKMKNAYEE